MMDLRRLTAENFCQFDRLDEPLNPGLIVLLGMNGAGKSNFVRAVYLCLAGEVYGTPNLVRDGHAKGFVALEAAVDKGVFKVTRSLKHNPKTRGTSITHRLEADWLNAPLSRKADITAFLAPYIGVSIAALDQVSFALQGAFDSLMMAEHTPRAKMLNTFMGLDRAEKLREVLKSSQDLLADLPDRTEALKEAALQEEELEQQFNEADGIYTAEKEQITEAAERAYATALVIKDKPSSKTRDEQLKEYKAAEADFLQRIQNAEAVIADRAKKIEDVAPPDTQEYLKYKEWSAADDAMCTAESAYIEWDREEIKRPPEDTYERCGEEVLTALLDARKRIDQLTEKVESYGTGVCKSCGQKLPVDFDIEEVKKELAELQEQYEPLNKTYEEAKAVILEYNEQSRKHQEERERRKTAWDLAVAKFKRLDDMSGFDEDAYHAKLAAYNEAASLQQQQKKSQEYLDALRKDYSDVRVKIAEQRSLDVASEEEIKHAENLIKAFNLAKLKITEAERKRNGLYAQLEGTRSRIKTLEEDIEKAKVNLEMTALLQFARDQLHVEKLPRLAAQGSIRVINRAMKKYLDMFAFPYGFRLDENSDFVVDFETSAGHPAAILSGGERVRAALAMRFALMDVFSAGCGILIIDEPTTALDSEAITALVEVLGTAASYFKTRKVKILCPTHAQQLASVADTVITIGETL